MAMDLLESTANGVDNGKDTLYMLGGIVLSNPFVRRYLSELGVGNLAQAVMPDVERYFRLRAM